MNDVVERDAQTQINFGKYLEEFAESMRSLCNQTKNHIEDSRDNIRDGQPTDAMDYMEERINNILSTLPGIAEFGENQKTRGKEILAAEEFTFKKK